LQVFWPRCQDVRVSLAETALDAILTLQLAIAWAGEGRCDPPRLGWWQTDLTDPDGGGDLLRRLLPRTHAWAGLEAVREAARRTDARLRTSLAHPDQLRTIYFLGFEVDERLQERLSAHKRSGVEPRVALPGLVYASVLVDGGASFSPETFATYLRAGRVVGEAAVVPGGRELKGAVPDEPALLVAKLASILVPFAPQYPLPHARLRP
jgi:hypothetical protein